MALEDFAAEMDRCSQCSYCKWIPFDHVKSWRFATNCPSVSYYHFNSYSARGRYAVARSLLRGDCEVSETVRNIAFTCMTCGSCDVSCKICRYNLEPLEMVRELKFRLVEGGHGLEAHRAAIADLREGNAPSERPKAGRGDWANGLDVPRLPEEKAAVLFHAGCRFSFDKQAQPTVRAALQLLTRGGVEVGIFGDRETCCGGRFYSMGYRDEFVRMAKANLAAWAEAGVKTVITSCADGYHAFKRLYPSLGSQVEVLHTVEVLDRLFREGRLIPRAAIPMTVTYHDPCHLGRQGEAHVPWDGVEKKIKGQIVVHEPKKPRYNGAWGVYEPARNVLKRIPGLELVEMERTREFTWCCGAGGGVREGYPEFSRWTASERVAEAKASGAQALVSACPWCESNFNDALAAAGDGLQVFDVADLVWKAM